MKLRVKAVFRKTAYIQYTEGHKNSKGESAPWTIRKHTTKEILQSYPTKNEAEEGLTRMRKFKHLGSEIPQQVS